MNISIDSIAAWLEREVPEVYRLIQPPFRLLMRALGRRPSYWEKRQDFNYYREVIRLAREWAPGGGRVIDVGANETALLRQLDWFEQRVALDIRRFFGAQEGIQRITTDFLAYRPERPFDLVLCLQVLEHLAEPAVFARKLFDTGATVIITVPYKWPKGECKTHVQDPVDETNLREWTQREPLATSVVMDDKTRLVAVYRSERRGDP